MIGKGSVVQAIRSIRGIANGVPIGVTEGALYTVRDVLLKRSRHTVCGECRPGIVFEGQPEVPGPFGSPASWCPCLFRPWPPPTDEALRCEPVDQDEPVPA